MKCIFLDMFTPALKENLFVTLSCNSFSNVVTEVRHILSYVVNTSFRRVHKAQATAAELQVES